MLKLVGMLTMLADHAGFLFDIPEYRIIGRACFPLFAFMAAYGWGKTRDKHEYIRRMMILAVFSELPFIWMYRLAGEYAPMDRWFYAVSFMIGMSLIGWGLYLISKKLPARIAPLSMADRLLVLMFFVTCIFEPHTNVLYTLTASLFIMQALDCKQADAMEKVILVSGVLLSIGIFCDYSFLGILLTVGLHIARPGGPFMRLSYETSYYGKYMVLFVWSVSMGVFYESVKDIFGMFVGAAMILWYCEMTQHRNAPRFVRTACYWFYPLHLLVLDVLKFYMK